MEEGFVALLERPNGNLRIKIKNPKYLAISHLRGNGVVSYKKIASLVWANGHEEYLAYFPESYPLFKPYIDAFERMYALIAKLEAECKDIKDQKEFAMKVKDTPVASIMFARRKGFPMYKISDSMNEESKLSVLDRLKDKERYPLKPKDNREE